ncbi:hypothetical protein EV383_2472 [Pseudonocardia sediminis]|uniref:Uncharacterized protein n=1 Tax=Pseudonocardia sediminis TaxID=1397368 RepID=A0A4Q7UUH2_PSEST|nr:hypothetical protein EV383_2472 [Pseudonocardia sediminis]
MRGRRPVYRSGVPVLVLLLALLSHTALGPLLACHARTAEATAVSVATVAGADDCVGCPPETETPTAATWSAPGSAGPDGCTAGHPCHHLPSDGHAVDDVGVRASDAPRIDAAPAPASRCLTPERPEPLRVPVSVSGPVPLPGEREPVAVLCVDRN